MCDGCRGGGWCGLLHCAVGVAEAYDDAAGEDVVGRQCGLRVVAMTTMPNMAAGAAAVPPLAGCWTCCAISHAAGVDGGAGRTVLLAMYDGGLLWGWAVVLPAAATVVCW